VSARAKRYDRAYFDRWYRNPRTRIHLADALERKVALAVSAAEHLNAHRVERVLDVGCGEASWHPALKRMRPRVSYQGVDSSEYSVARWGRRRNVMHSTFGGLGQLDLDGPYDLIVCADVLHYVPDRELAPGLAALASLLGGVAFIEVFTARDSIVGDHREIKLRSSERYRRLFRAAGLVHCGLCCFVRDDFAPGVTAFERGWS
jgi:SAM-dependent methyltransferase